MHVLTLFFKQIFGYFSFMFAFLWMFNIPYLFGHLVFIIYLYCIQYCLFGGKNLLTLGSCSDIINTYDCPPPLITNKPI